MLQHINGTEEYTREDIWNERFGMKMKEKGYSQRSFAEAYSKKYGKQKNGAARKSGTTSQTEVCKWLHVGELDGKTNKKRGFPAYETMKNIADLLDVDLGYLIGETDCATFDLKHTSEFLGLSTETVSAIRDITFGKKKNSDKTESHEFNKSDYDEYRLAKKYPDSRRTAAFSFLVSSPSFVNYLYGLVNLAIAINNQKNPRSRFEMALSQIPEEFRDDAVKLFSDSENAIENGMCPTDRLWEYARKLETADYEDVCLPDELAMVVRAERYSLSEKHMELTKEITREANIEAMAVEPKVVNYDGIFNF